MLTTQPLPTGNALIQTMRDDYRQDENRVAQRLLPVADTGSVGRVRAWQKARQLVEGIRAAQVGKGGVDALLNEFSLSTEEGVVLMCLAEALLRVPDKFTIDELIRDKLSAGNWSAHLGNSASLFVNASAWGLLLTGKLVNYSGQRKDEAERQKLGTLKSMLGRMGEPVIRSAIRQAMQIMGSQFVMGETIGRAIRRATVQEHKGYRYSYDMLGEGARTMADAERYFNSYRQAIDAIGQAAQGRGPIASPGISIKLSALHPRYDFAHRQRVMEELVPRVTMLALQAQRYDIGFTIDAEEADRLELSLEVIAAVFRAPELAGWKGFGLAVQAYQKRALLVVDWVAQLAREQGRPMMVRLVKGAYWDSEIKWSQEGGFEDYPVFTRKPTTDLSYQACAKRLLAYRDCLYPQFATHNAYTVATILELDDQCEQASRQGFEFQRLHGMGDALYDQVLAEEGVSCRIYAPVGEHADLLAYLVRRLLENGANSSFVNNIVDASVSIDSLLQDPVETVRAWSCVRHPGIPLPRDLYKGAASEAGQRANSEGLDLTHVSTLEPLQRDMLAHWQQLQQGVSENRELAAAVAITNPANVEEVVGQLVYDTPEDMLHKLERAQQAQPRWSQTPVAARAKLLRDLADQLQHNAALLMTLCCKEAGKTLADGVAEVREAIDFCRYYADQAERLHQDPALQARGVILCISPWNFPLAIFLGQVTAAMVTGNTVLAKPAEQTSLVAMAALRLMHAAGMPQGVVELIVSPGKPVGELLLPDARIQGVMFTGSTATGAWLNQALAQRDEVDLPLIAETGGQNAMIVDSTALPEQVVDDVVMSGFQSAGQRCSALRVLFVQEDVAPKIIHMVQGAMQELSIGDPALLSTDVGPVIDARALARLQAHRDYLSGCGERAKLLYACELPEACSGGLFFAPHFYEISDLSVLKQEVFGPVVHLITFKASELDQVIEQINASGFGLTLGVHSRIQTVCERVAKRAKVGNVYINRNMIGAIVGVQPFGGHGLSGTGPKAGGPLYLRRLVTAVEDQTSPPVLVRNTVALAEAAADATSWPELASWSASSAEQRCAVVKTFLSELVRQSSLVLPLDTLLTATQQLLRQAGSQLFEAVTLPGPTGERNQWLLEARGLLALFCDDAESVDQLLLKLLATVLSGNRLVVVADAGQLEPMQEIVRLLEHSGLPESVIRVRSLAHAQAVLMDSHLQGVLAAAGSPLTPGLRQTLAKREGAILPLLLETPAAGLLLRLVVEKSISTDTTAAGGNTSLMTMDDRQQRQGELRVS